MATRETGGRSTVLHIRRRLPAAAAAALAGLVGGAVAFAAIPGSDGVIHACITNGLGGGGLRAVESPEGCRPNETPLAWNQRGAQGEPGPAGPQGEPGRPGVSRVFDAHVDGPSSGTRLPADGSWAFVQSKELPAGSYVVEAALGLVNGAPAGEPLITHCVLSGGTLITGYIKNVDGRRDGMDLQGVTKFARPGTIHVRCRNPVRTAASTVFFPKITALEVDAIE